MSKTPKPNVIQLSAKPLPSIAVDSPAQNFAQAVDLTKIDEQFPGIERQSAAPPRPESDAAVSTIVFTARSLLLAGTALISCAIFFYFVDETSIRIPVYDMLDWLQFYDQRTRADDWVGYLWAPHNEHRMVFTRALIAIDMRFLDGQGTAFVIFDTLLWAGMILTVWRVIVSAGGQLSFTISACSVALMLLAPTYVVTTISIPVMGPFIQTSSFVLFSIVLVSRQQRGGCGLRCSAAILCACLSSFGVSAGLLVWPVLTWSAWRNRLGPSWTGIIAGAGVIFVWLYLWKMPARTYQSLFNLENFVASVDYGIRFLGLPWSHAAELVWPARLVGAMLLVLGILIVLRQSVVKNGTTPQRIGAALILFTFLCAGAAAISRVDIPGPTSVRYAMFVVLAHLGLFLFALPYLEKMWEYGKSRWCLVAAIVLSGGWLAHQMLVGRMAMRETGHYNDAWARFIAGEWTPDMIYYVYPDREQAIAKLAYLRDNHVGWTLTPSAPGRR